MRRLLSPRVETSEGVVTAPGVTLDVDAGLGVITIDRPDVRNALGLATVAELVEAAEGEARQQLHPVRREGKLHHAYWHCLIRAHRPE